METKHKPVLMAEVLDYLNPQENQNFVDGTVGGGGHAEEILNLIAPNGKLLALDWDAEAIKRVKKILAEYKDRLILVNDSYVNLKEVVQAKKFTNIQGILLDLGLSSDQLEVSGRGFSFRFDEPLDMRFNQETEIDASQIVNEYSIDNLTKIFKDYGEESRAKQVAREIVQSRENEPIKTTKQLIEIVERIIPNNKKINPATKIFQALRIEVNQELENVKNILKDAIDLLQPGGRLAIITFHSLEDKIVKEYFKQASRDCICPPEIPVCRCNHKKEIKLITRKPVLPTKAEIHYNKRCRSAKLRVVEKI